MRFSDHALGRIIRGDEKGLRTILSPDEILTILQSDKVVRWGERQIFYSPKDAKCVVAVVDGREQTVITVTPADETPVSKRLLAERLVVGAEAFFADLPLPQSKKKSDAALVSCNIHSVIKTPEKVVHSGKGEHMLFTWFDFRLAHVCRSRMFHHLLIEQMETAAATLEPPLRLSSLSFRGVGWSWTESLHLPYQFLGLEPPHF